MALAGGVGPNSWARARAGWHPGSLGAAALLYWFAADRDITIEDTDRVSGWTDLSGNGNHVASTGASRPVLTADYANGKPGIVFDGFDDYLERATLTQGAVATPYRRYCVYRKGTHKAAVVGLVGNQSNNASLLYLHQSTNHPSIYCAPIGTPLQTGALPTEGSMNIASGLFNGGSSSVSNREAGEDIVTFSGTVGTSPHAGLKIGTYHTAPGSTFNSGICEVLCTNSTDPDLHLRIIAYLDLKWL